MTANDVKQVGALADFALIVVFRGTLLSFCCLHRYIDRQEFSQPALVLELFDIGEGWIVPPLKPNRRHDALIAGDSGHLPSFG